MERIESSASCLAFPRARLLSFLPRSMMANIKTFAVRPSVQKVQHSRRRIIKICSWKMNSTEMDRSAQIIINILNVECAIGIGRFTRLPPGPRRRPSLLLQLVQRRIPHTHHHLVVIVIVGAAPLLIPPPPPPFKWRYYSAVIEDVDGDMDTGCWLGMHGAAKRAGKDYYMLASNIHVQQTKRSVIRE